MADKSDKETPETPEGADAQSVENDAAPEAVAEGSATPEVAAEAPEAEPAEADAAATQALEAGATEDQAPAAEASEDEIPAAEAPTAEDSEPAAAPVKAAPAPGEELSPKERRRRTRSKHAGEARPVRSPEERHAERLAERRTKAVRRRARRLQERTKAAERRAVAPAAQPLAPVHAPVEGKRQVRQGVVVSDKAEKTITVRIDVARRHRRYEKIVRSSNTLHAHDENNDAHEGDVVRVIESKPLSRMKRWKLIDVLERAR
jgi:small subunit ribosomal protein S17